MPAGVQRGVYAGRATLRYARERVEGATTLLVAFPRLRTEPARPPVGLRRRHLQGIEAHRLYLGSDEHVFIGPQRRFHGLRTARELVEREAAALDVPRERIACIGTSTGAIFALATGLMLGAGRIIAGAPPVRTGSTLRRFSGRLAGPKAEAPLLLDLVRRPGHEDPAEFLDRWLFDLSAACTAPCAIDLLVGNRDYAAEQVREFATSAACNPLLDVRLHEIDYGKHGSVADGFYAALPRLLASETRRAPVPAVST